MRTGTTTIIMIIRTSRCPPGRTATGTAMGRCRTRIRMFPTRTIGTSTEGLPGYEPTRPLRMA
jgi:hypothetical protein